MPGVRKAGCRVNAPADNELVPGHDLIADNAQGGPEDPPPDMAGGAVLDQLLERDDAGRRQQPARPWAGLEDKRLTAA
jgi:hypothetical protein